MVEITITADGVLFEVRGWDKSVVAAQSTDDPALSY
jgi:hypothetical protein